jgi:hypothetical protein
MPPAVNAVNDIYVGSTEEIELVTRLVVVITANACDEDNDDLAIAVHPSVTTAKAFNGN